MPETIFKDEKIILKEISDLTTGRDVDGNQIPSFCFTNVVTNDFPTLTDDDVVELAKKIGCKIFKTLANEHIESGIIVANKKCSKDTIKKEVSEMFGMDVDIEEVESKEVEELKENYYLESNPLIYVTTSPYKVKNVLLSSKEEIRILYDYEENIYLICNAYISTHLDAVKDAMKDGYFSEYKDAQDYADNGSWETWKFIPSKLIDNSYENQQLGLDDYWYRIHYIFGDILARFEDFLDYELFNILGEPLEVYEFVGGKEVLMEESLNEDIPVKTGIAYKLFKVKNGKLYPPVVANPNGEDTPIGVWLDAQEGEFAGLSKTGRPQVKSTGNGKLAFRPGWHLGDLPYAPQFESRKNPGYMSDPNFVWGECEYAMDVDYQKDADEQGYMRTKVDDKGNVQTTRSDKYQHSLAGLKKLPDLGYYKYRTNPDPNTIPWVITGQMRVNRILSDEEVEKICKDNGVPYLKRPGGEKTLGELGLKESLDLEEKAEKHETLNPKLWNEDGTLKEEVKEKIMEISNEFLDDLKEDGIKFNLKDIRLVGSNCSYNYNEHSDLDIHLIMDTDSLECPDDLYPLLYSAYRSIFNKKFDIDFYGIPVEIYVETM